MATADDLRAAKLTKAQQSLARVVAACGRMGVTMRDVRRAGIHADFERARRAGLIQHAGYEVSVAAEDWLVTEAGRRAIASAESDERRGK